MNIQLHPFIPLFFVNPGYLVTDAERRTERYSNLFAAHILRQHQFNALCGARHWKNKLRLMVDDEIVNEASVEVERLRADTRP